MATPFALALVVATVLQPAIAGTVNDLLVGTLSYYVDPSLSTLTPFGLGAAEIYYPQDGLTGTLPNALSGLPVLTGLFLFENSLTRSLPKEWSAMQTLKDLDLSMNMLSGTLPAQWSALSSLQNLFLFSNKIGGMLPAEWTNLTNMGSLILHTNPLSGPIPDWSGLALLSFFRIDNSNLCRKNNLASDSTVAMCHASFPCLVTARFKVDAA